MSLLTDRIYPQPGHLIRRAHQLAWAVFMDETRGLGVTQIQYAALIAILDHPGIDATRLSELISFDRATIGNVVGRMEARGLVRRSSDKKDRRAKRIFVTARGQKTIKRVARVAPHIGPRILARLNSADRKRLVQLLRQLVDMEDLERRASLAAAEQPAKTRSGVRKRRKTAARRI